MDIQRIVRERDSLFCEIWFGLRLAWIQGRTRWQQKYSEDVSMQTSPVLRGRQALAETRVFLRKILRSYPYWAEGHIRLGLVEVRLQSLADEPVTPRALATIRLSVQAARQLLSSSAPQKGRVALEADFLEAILVFFAKRHEEALRLFEALLTPEHSVQLSEGVYLSSLENAGALALLLDQREKALSYFLEIPEKKRTSEALSALRLLSNPMPA